jgi:hypothetical protein
MVMVMVMVMVIVIVIVMMMVMMVMKISRFTHLEVGLELAEHRGRHATCGGTLALQGVNCIAVLLQGYYRGVTEAGSLLVLYQG